ncbi:MAG: hypothetical protein K2Y28_02740, partial [Burkholderiaceae bacterium]|nr:hypothetical protein [Burkholderiaceae bacterium]
MKMNFKVKSVQAAFLLTIATGASSFAQSIPTPATTPAKAPSRGTVVVKASGTLTVNVGPKFELKINGTSYGLVEVRSSTARDYSFVLRNPVPAGAKIEVVYRNDYLRDGQDRNLFVDSVTINGLTLSSSSTGVVFDQGAGAQAFDNLNTVPGKREMTTNGALRFIWPSAIGGPVVIGGGNGGSGGSTCNALPNTTT